MVKRWISTIVEKLSGGEYGAYAYAYTHACGYWLISADIWSKRRHHNVLHRFDILTIVFAQVRPVLLGGWIVQLAVAIQITKGRVEAARILLITSIARAFIASKYFKVL